MRFLDPVPKPELARLLRACDIGVHCIEDLPILERGMSPNKVFDYLAAGLPVVSNAGAGLAQVMDDGQCGATGATNDLASLLRRVAAGLPEKREEWVSNGRRILADGHSRAAASQSLEHVLDDVTARRRADVAHLTTAHKPTDNRIFRKEVLALQQAGVDVCLVAPAEADTVVEGARIVALPRRSTRLRRMAVGPVDVLRTLRQLRPKVVHLHDPELIPLGILARRLLGVKVVFDAHEDLPKQVWGKPYLPGWAKKPTARFAQALERSANRHFDAIVAATPPIARNFSHPRTVLVQNYPWLSDFPEPTPYAAAPAGTYAYVGGLTPVRGSREMLAAVTSTAGAVLTVAGPVTPEVAEELESNARVTYAGVLPVAEVPQIVAASQAGFVLFHPLPNHLECQPTKLFEYMAAARPFIASDFPYWRELLGADAGVFVDPQSVDSIRAAMDELAADPDEAARKGQAGRRLVEEKFTFESQAAALVELTRQLLG